jgi:chemotaxis protein MotA
MADDEISIAPLRRSIDLATILGLVGALGLIATAIYFGGSVTAFIDLPAILIVFGGTTAATTACFSLAEVRSTAAVVGKTLFQTVRQPAHAAIHVMQLAQMARKHGILALQDIMETLRFEPFLQKGVSMVVDGIPGDEVEGILRRDVAATGQRHARAASVLRRASELAPAMGLIGTLIGLVQMLANLDDPSTIGPSMAIALLTTFYGAVLANIVLVPLASKLERNASVEEMVNTIYVLGVASIGRQENPRRLEMLVNSIMPPASRVRFFD